MVLICTKQLKVFVYIVFFVDQEKQLKLKKITQHTHTYTQGGRNGP
jgi:hypothetical protein